MKRLLHALLFSRLLSSPSARRRRRAHRSPGRPAAAPADLERALAYKNRGAAARHLRDRSAGAEALQHACAAVQSYCLAEQLGAGCQAAEWRDGAASQAAEAFYAGARRPPAIVHAQNGTLLAGALPACVLHQAFCQLGGPSPAVVDGMEGADLPAKLRTLDPLRAALEPCGASELAVSFLLDITSGWLVAPLPLSCVGARFEKPACLRVYLHRPHRLAAAPMAGPAPTAPPPSRAVQRWRGAA